MLGSTLSSSQIVIKNTCVKYYNQPKTTKKNFLVRKRLETNHNFEYYEYT